jgi:TRAP-type C4-dicarboxylate transport system substrate-binding protein
MKDTGSGRNSCAIEPMRGHGNRCRWLRRNIDDLQSMKFRVMGNPMFVDMMNALGGNGVAMGYDQVFSALQTGVVDGAENNPPSFVFDNHYQVAKYYTLDEHLIVPEIVVFSKRTWDTLSKADQALLIKFGREAQLEERALWVKYEKEAMDKAKTAGITISEIADKKPFQDTVKPVWDKYGPNQAHSGHSVAGSERIYDPVANASSSWQSLGRQW